MRGREIAEKIYPCLILNTAASADVNTDQIAYSLRISPSLKSKMLKLDVFRIDTVWYRLDFIHVERIQNNRS